jgi:hypothetical protein
MSEARELAIKAIYDSGDLEHVRIVKCELHD